MSKGFDLSNLNQNIQSFRQENESLAGDNITLNFELPDGGKLSGTFKAGQDVEWAKDFISKQINCNINDITLFFNGKSVPEILSFVDVAGLENGSTVQVQIKQ